ncbi:MAG TPA: tripartite tricarboxylate transporter substrate binding protein [Burkholderiales bacterium]|jgi:tripartite-type tricarboxylate transporter receptor subunit TctC|nr:tripartite tricarboxylate transporter substrate binding protein [Burkholderiales bacterium]
MMNIAGWLFATIALLAMPAHAATTAEKYPARPVRLIIPSGAGGVTDILGRVISAKLTDSLGQQVIVDNRPGASGIVGSQIVAKSPPDGYTLLMVFPSHPVNPALYPDIPYDTVKAFAPISMVSAVAPVLVVGTQFPARTMKDFIALAKAKPGQLNHGSVGSGSMGSLAAELLRTMADIRFTQVAYKGSPQALTAVMAGEIEFYMMGSAGTAVPNVKAGRIRALGVGAKQRLVVLPDVPAISETIPGYEARGWNGILAPAGTPKPIIDRLHGEIVKIVKSPEFAQVLTSEGATAVGNTPAEFDAIIRADLVKWAKIIKENGIRAQ